MLNLDTHIVLHALAGSLTPRERAVLATERWSMSAIVLWEIAKLRQLRRIAIDLEDPEVVRALSRIHVWPLTLTIAKVSTELDVAGDPADQIIAATSVVEKVPLLTRDRVLRKSKRVPLATGRPTSTPPP